MGVYVGCDIGTVSVKAAILDVGRTLGDSVGNGFLSPYPTALTGNDESRLYLTPYRRIKGSPDDAVAELLGELFEHVPQELIANTCLTGSAGLPIALKLGAESANEFKSLSVGVGATHPDVRNVLEMGGENSKFLTLSALDDGTVGIADYDTNGDCAAGTGSFMDQQATRLQFSVEFVGELVSQTERAAKIAGRCSVFAKSDMIHAQQKGSTPVEVLKGLCEAVARNFKGNVAKGRNLEGRSIFVGGVAVNEGIYQALRKVFSIDNGDLFVPPAPAFYGAIGAAVLAERSDTPSGGINLGNGSSSRPALPSWPTLSLEGVRLLGEEFPEIKSPATAEGKTAGYLGIDVGSVSTNLVCIDEDGRMLHEIYLRTRARPVEVVDEGLREMEKTLGDRIEIMGVGTTGSGRELIGELVGADTVNDEITAHKTGSSHIAANYLGEKVDTIFEIGGQDSKFIHLEDGVVVDFTMNEACAAGTGSFLEEQAEKLGVSIVDEFSDLALAAEAPARLGERCTVYMEQDVSGYLRKGATKKDVIGGLAYSVVQNYLNRVVRGRPVGEVIFFQGGTAYNRSVAAAFSKVLDKRIIVPPHNGVVGALGAALLAGEKMRALAKESTFRGFGLNQVDYSKREFTCNGCSNSCDIQEFTIEGSKSYWGDKCSEKFRKKAKTPTKPVIEDLVTLRNEALHEDWLGRFENGLHGPKLEKLALKTAKLRGSRTDRPLFAMPRAMYFYEFHPFWKSYLEGLGIELALSGETTKSVSDLGVEHAVAEPCFPVQVAHGHVRELAERGASRLLLPSIINSATDDMKVGSHVCPWGQTLPFVIAASTAVEGMEKRVMIPILHFRRGEEFVEKELYRDFSSYASSRRHHRSAVSLAFAAQRGFKDRLRKLGAAALAILEETGQTGILLIGRPYNMYDAGVNLNVPTKLRADYGANVIPLDFLDLEGVDITSLNPNMYWNYGRKILKGSLFSSVRDNLHMIYLTNFKCGPDSYVKHFAQNGAGKPFLTLQFDGHTNDAGAMTRCEAYLDSKGVLRWWKNQPTRCGDGLCTSQACAPDQVGCLRPPSAASA